MSQWFEHAVDIISAVETEWDLRKAGFVVEATQDLISEKEFEDLAIMLARKSLEVNHGW